MITGVPDTNIWLAGIQWSGRPREIRRRAERGEVALATSLEILSELMHVLRDYFGYSDEEAYEWYVTLGELCTVVQPQERVEAVPDDPDDNKFLECALAANAQYVVSRDWDLLRVRRYREVEIVDDEQFLAILEGTSGGSTNPT